MKNGLLLIMSLSIVLQFTAAFMAIRLISLSGAFVAWILLACGFIIQAVRRVISLNHLLDGRSQGDMTVELLGLVISLCMLCGIWKFGPLFAEIRNSQEAMKQKQDELHEANLTLESESAERQKTEEHLRESEERYRAVAEYSYGWEYWIDADGSFRYISPYCKEVTGYDREEFYADPLLMRKIIHPEDVGVYENHFRQAFSCTNHAEPFDFRIITRNGQVRWINHVCRSVFDSHGNTNGRRTSNRDITDRKQMEQQLHTLNFNLEERVAVRTADLSRLNKELESFCYSISHELRAPLARLEAFSKVLTECATDPKPDELMHLAERIGVSSLRLKSVIDALLQMTRISQKKLDLESVDLSRMADQIMSELLEDVIGRQVKVSIAPGLVVTGDRPLISVLLNNLLRNALKYTLKTTEAAVELGSLVRDGAVVYYVRDNGAGFDMAFAGNLFEPFCRLHSASEFEGNGIGLATVQRIIERHGGKIWAEAEPGKGATFYFTLGAVMPDRGE